MRPTIKKKRIDPRYFLHESIEEELSQAQRSTMDTDDDNDIDAKDLATLRKNKGKQEHETASDDDDNDGVRNDDDGPGKTLLKGEKSLYEKIRGAIEEVIDEYLEEDATVVSRTDSGEVKKGEVTVRGRPVGKTKEREGSVHPSAKDIEYLASITGKETGEGLSRKEAEATEKARSAKSVKYTPKKGVHLSKERR